MTEKEQTEKKTEKQTEKKMNFKDLGVRGEILRAIRKQGFEHPTPIQEKVIPLALDGKNVVGSAQTGSGKTAAFMIPVLQSLMENGSGFRCLVVEPTRELAMQVRDVTEEMGKYTGLKCVVVFGGVPAGGQLSKIRDGVDILVATPGRLYDLVWQGAVDFDNITHFIVDEVDRMLDMGFIEDIERIISFLPRRSYQKMFFSATLPPEVRRPMNKLVGEYVEVAVGGKSKPATGITHELYPVRRQNKTKLLIELLKGRGIDSAIIFVETKRTADKLQDEMKKKRLNVAAFHSGFTQVARYDRLDMFKRGKIKFLVATNVAARGLDITGITHIYNYEVPQLAEDYVHRIGRSARADATGIAVTLASPEEARYLSNIERLIKMKLPRKHFGELTMDDLRPSKSRSGGGGGRGGYSGKPRSKKPYKGKKRPAGGQQYKKRK